MQNLPLVSIICISYNHEAFVVETLDSVLNQSYPNIELIILDDCSPDNSKEVIENWLLKNNGYTFISNTTNKGNTKSFNNALKVTKGSFIMDLAADDILEVDCIANLLQPFLENKKLGLVYANAKLIDEAKNFISLTYNTDEILPPSGAIYETIIGQKIQINSVASLVNKKVYDELNGYDENLMYEDLDLWVRASRIYDFQFVDKVVIQKRVLGSSLGSQFYKRFNKRTRKLNNSTYKIIQKAILLNKTSTENKALLKRLHYEMDKALKTFDFILFVKYIPLEIKLRLS